MDIQVCQRMQLNANFTYITFIDVCSYNDVCIRVSLRRSQKSGTNKCGHDACDLLWHGGKKADARRL